MGARMCKRQLPFLAYGPTYPASTNGGASRTLMPRVCASCVALRAIPRGGRVYKTAISQG